VWPQVHRLDQQLDVFGSTSWLRLAWSGTWAIRGRWAARRAALGPCRRGGVHAAGIAMVTSMNFCQTSILELRLRPEIHCTPSASVAK